MLTRVLTVNLETKYYSASIPKRTINYYGEELILSDLEYQKIFYEIPTLWNSEKDKLLRFIVFEDNTYFCEREKLVFNYVNRENEIKIYKFDYPDKKEASNLFKFFAEKYSEIKISRIDNLYNEVMEKIKDMSFIKVSLLTARNQMLVESDYKMMPDYPIDDEEKNHWITYRQELRDITKQKAWIENDFMNIYMPVSPDPKSQIDLLNSYFGGLNTVPELLSNNLMESLNTSSLQTIIKTTSQISLKFEVIKALSKIKLPIIDFNYASVNNEQNSFENYVQETLYDNIINKATPSTWWEAAVSGIENKIEEINTKLSSYNLDFTINDIIDSVVEQNKLTDQELEINTIIEEL